MAHGNGRTGFITELKDLSKQLQAEVDSINEELVNYSAPQVRGQRLPTQSQNAINALGARARKAQAALTELRNILRDVNQKCLDDTQQVKDTINLINNNLLTLKTTLKPYGYKPLAAEPLLAPDPDFQKLTSGENPAETPITLSSNPGQIETEFSTPSQSKRTPQDFHATPQSPILKATFDFSQLSLLKYDQSKEPEEPTLLIDINKLEFSSKAQGTPETPTLQASANTISAMAKASVNTPETPNLQMSASTISAMGKASNDTPETPEILTEAFKHPVTVKTPESPDVHSRGVFENPTTPDVHSQALQNPATAEHKTPKSPVLIYKFDR